MQIARPAPAPVVDEPRSALQKLMASPVAFAAIFIVGFGLAFAVAASFLWGGADVEGMLASGKADEALAALDAKKQLSPQELRWKGHALYQKGNREGMLRAYQAAVLAKSVDERALVNTLDSLGYEKVASLAVKTLEDWPGQDVDERLVALSTDDTALRRHAALNALKARSTSTPNQKLLAEIKVAVTDVNSEICDVKAGGIASIASFVERPEAAPYLKQTGAWKALYEQDADVVFAKYRCLDAALVKRTLASLSTITR